MQTGIHPKYHQNAVVHCTNCDHEFKIAGTIEKQTTEICSLCHPFFTGKKVLIDTEGRVDKFRKKAEAASGRKKKSRKKTTLEERFNLELSEQLKKDAAKEEKEKAEKAAKKAAKAAKTEKAETPKEEAPAETKETPAKEETTEEKTEA